MLPVVEGHGSWSSSVVFIFDFVFDDGSVHGVRLYPSYTHDCDELGYGGDGVSTAYFVAFVGSPLKKEPYFTRKLVFVLKSSRSVGLPRGEIQ